MPSPTLRQIERNTAVDPVKCTPARSGLDRHAPTISSAPPWTKLMTPSGRPAARNNAMTSWALRIASGDGFHTTTLPSIAGADGRLPAIAVKLNGVIAATKPSSGRTSVEFQRPGACSSGSARWPAQ